MANDPAQERLILKARLKEQFIKLQGRELRVRTRLAEYGDDASLLAELGEIEALKRKLEQAEALLDSAQQLKNGFHLSAHQRKPSPLWLRWSLVILTLGVLAILLIGILSRLF